MRSYNFATSFFVSSTYMFFLFEKQHRHTTIWQSSYAYMRASAVYSEAIVYRF